MANDGLVHCDATGSIVASSRGSAQWCDELSSKRLLYYAVVVQHPQKWQPPIAVAEMVSSSHTVVAISHFLHVFRHAEAKVHGFSSLSMPRYAVIDRSSVLLLSFLHVFNGETLAAFLQRAFRIVTKKASQTDLQLLVPHACMSHVMKDAKKEWQLR